MVVKATEPHFLPLSTYEELPAAVMQERLDAFEGHLQRRRTVRQFSGRPVPRSTPPRNGRVSLTHTPSPMGFLTEILGRPKDIERPYLLLVVGYPGDGACVPDIVRKPLAEIATFLPL